MHHSDDSNPRAYCLDGTSLVAVVSTYNFINCHLMDERLEEQSATMIGFDLYNIQNIFTPR
jgi:hypothetical protein